MRDSLLSCDLHLYAVIAHLETLLGRGLSLPEEYCHFELKAECLWSIDEILHIHCEIYQRQLKVSLLIPVQERLTDNDIELSDLFFYFDHIVCSHHKSYHPHTQSSVKSVEAYLMRVICVIHDGGVKLHSVQSSTEFGLVCALVPAIAWLIWVMSSGSRLVHLKYMYLTCK